MYKKNAEISDTYGFVYNDEKVYTHRRVGTLQELSLKGEILWESKESGIWEYNVYCNNIIFNLYNKDGRCRDTYIYDKTTKENWFHKEVELSSITESNYYKNNILYNFEDDQIMLFDLLEGKVSKIIPFDSKGLPSLFTDNCFVERQKANLFIYSNSDFSFLWKQNIKTYYPNAEDDCLNAIKIYQDSLLVITDAGVLRLSVSDGSVIWKTDGYARTMEVVGNIGYVCTSASFYKINLDTGEESGYGWEYDRLPDFTYQGEVYWASGYDVVFHDGLLWYSAFSSGHSFLIAINPENGNYEWIHHVDTNDKTGSPQFYGDKMFLSDTGGLLHIYEKEK